ncbi:MAG TPA: endolytic transglycosylase MltG [Solirubrobacteraceae bacterium]|nr:endolytic transglycosylase MltG [Solirubrobacteraceae bacterium]
MPEGRGRTAAERETARRERANRRARQEGREEPYPEPSAEPGAAPGFVAGDPEPMAAESAAADPEPMAAESAAADPEPAAADPRPDPTPAASDREPAAADPELDPEPDPDDSDPLIEPRATAPEPRAEPPRPIKSFPSPPDPEFYVPDDQLEMPSGTRRVSRGSRVGAGGRSRPPRRSRSHHSRSHRPGMRWLGRFVALIMLALAAAVVWFVIELFQPFGVSPHGHVTVRIPERTSSSTVARMLAADGVISSRFFFELRATLDGSRRDIRAGTYQLQRGMSYEAVLNKLTAIPKKARTSELTIAEGHTRQYVAALLRKQHVAGSYLTATRRSTLLDPRHYGAPKSTDTLEGFLFPDTFQLRDPIKMSALVADQLKDFKRRFAKINLAGARARHQSAFDVITIASLIEAESASPRDDRLVSSVIENRLRDHMMLQLDSTARYATGNFTKALTTKQLESRSPYNTHTHYGLPPGPIDSPGLTALRAAAAPASSHYLYFFSKPCTHQTVFASSYGQFELLLIRDRRLHCPK